MSIYVSLSVRRSIFFVCIGPTAAAPASEGEAVCRRTIPDKHGRRKD